MKNNKGYMLIEIVISFALTFAIVIFLTNLVIKFKNTNEDIYYSAKYYKDKNLITRNIMEDLEKVNIREVEKQDNDLLIIIEYLDESNNLKLGNRKLSVANNTITYGKYDYNNGVFMVSDTSYYNNKLESSLKIENIDYSLNEDNLNIKIRVKSIYSDESYDINLFVPTTNIKYSINEKCNIYTNYYFLNAIYLPGIEKHTQNVFTSGANILVEDLEKVVFMKAETVKLCEIDNDPEDDTECGMTFSDFYTFFKETISDKGEIYPYTSELDGKKVYNEVKIYNDPTDETRKFITSGAWNLSGIINKTNLTVQESSVEDLVKAVVYPDELEININPGLTEAQNKDYIEDKKNKYIPINVIRKFLKTSDEYAAIPVNGYYSGQPKEVVVSPAMYKIVYKACKIIKVIN